MKLKAMVSSLDGIDEPLRDLYESREVGGQTMYFLQVEGIDAHPDVRGLKQANEARRAKLVAAETKVADLEARLEGLPDDFDADALDALKRRADAGGKAPDPVELERTIAERVAKATKKINDEKAAAEAARDKAIKRSDDLERDKVVGEALDAAGIINPAARRGARAMLIKDCEVIYDDTGEASVVFHDRALDMRIPAADHIKAWADSDEGRFYVSPKGDAGGGAGGDGGVVKGSRVNPWKSGETWNMTEQHRLETSDPVTAKRLKAEAGVKD